MQRRLLPLKPVYCSGFSQSKCRVTKVRPNLRALLKGRNIPNRTLRLFGFERRCFPKKADTILDQYAEPSKN